MHLLENLPFYAFEILYLETRSSYFHIHILRISKDFCSFMIFYVYDNNMSLQFIHISPQ